VKVSKGSEEPPEISIPARDRKATWKAQEARMNRIRTFLVIISSHPGRGPFIVNSLK
jgi:hypothetical protein